MAAGARNGGQRVAINNNGSMFNVRLNGVWRNVGISSNL